VMSRPMTYEAVPHTRLIVCFVEAAVLENHTHHVTVIVMQCNRACVLALLPACLVTLGTISGVSFLVTSYGPWGKYLNRTHL
jgi:hypothetical protein